MRDCWPELPPEALAADFVFFDVDLGFDEQFPWRPGEAPMPLIALIGSEAPGRIEWALSQKADAQLLKPVGNAGVYSALLIARQTFRGAPAPGRRDRGAARSRVAERQTIVRAVAALSAQGIDDGRAYAQLRSLAMSWQVSVEEAARRIVAMTEKERAMTSPISPELVGDLPLPVKPRTGVWRRLLKRPLAVLGLVIDRHRRGRRDPCAAG